MGKAGQLPPDSHALFERLQGYGCATIIPFDESATGSRRFAPEQLDYLDLLLRPKETKLNGGRLAAAVQHQGSTLLYVVDAPENAAPSHTELASLRRLLANRSDPAWLGVCSPGELQIYPIGFNADADLLPVATIRAEQSDAPLFLQSLAQGTFAEGQTTAGGEDVFEEIRRLLEETTRAFVPHKKLAPLDVLSMAGRALFWRFLVDRDIVRDEDLERDCTWWTRRTAPDRRDAFENAENAAQTSAWLDRTFNGDFLPLEGVDESIASDDYEARASAYRRFYREAGTETNGAIFQHLTAILKGWEKVDLGFQTKFGHSWSRLDFAHIPVGVLSQVYEHFSHLVEAKEARAKSVHYTPRLIAELMAAQTFAALPAERRAEAKALDPACGAGIFLVVTYRRLVRERWLRDGERPDKDTLQRILYEQLRGFDVSEAALRLAALSLYITAIELNATPRPPKSLKFPRNLRGRVLFAVGGTDANGLELGSLGERAPSKDDGSFDLVIGNPPWTRHRETKPISRTKRREQSPSDRLNDAYTDIGQRVLRQRELPELADAYENPDKNPDWPFIWRATEWAKPGGLIALALHGRVFGQTGGKGLLAMRALLESSHTTGIINGADLRNTGVWSGMGQPFCLYFARNQRPPSKHRFVFSAPTNDPAPNRDGRFRIDYAATRAVSVERIMKTPWVLKTLTLGTWRDVETVDAINAAFPQTLADVWKAWNPEEDKTGQGYNRSPGLAQKHTSFLGNLLDFQVPNEGFKILFADLKTYVTNHGCETAYWPKAEALYQPPLVIVPQAPGDDHDKPRAYLSNQPLAFSQSFYGYSCANHPASETLAALLYLLPHSQLFAYHCAMTSWRLGFGRQTINKEDIDAIPFPDVTTLPAATTRRLQTLARRLREDATKPWDDINDCLFALYGLDADQREVIRDTLFSAAVYRRAGQEALHRTTRDTRAPFLNALHEHLAPFFTVARQSIEVGELPRQTSDASQPWHFITVTLTGLPATVNAALLGAAMQEADRTGASRVIIHLPHSGGLLIGLLNQRRWWTPTRARLCAQEIAQKHLDAFGSVAAA